MKGVGHMRRSFLRGRRSALGAVLAAGALAVTAVGLHASAAVAGTPSHAVKGAAAVDALVGKVPQHGLTLGEPGAPVELIEYGDLLCPICKDYSEGVIPQLIATQVDKGKIKLTFRNFLIIGPQSSDAATAALAAGEQGRGWNFIQLFLRNQQQEGTEYATGAFLQRIAVAAGVEDIARWNEERGSVELHQQGEATSAEAERKLHFEGTPSFAIRGPGTRGLEALGTPRTAKEFAGAITAAR
jgi:protein-disulfide isomerase